MRGETRAILGIFLALAMIAALSLRTEAVADVSPVLEDDDDDGDDAPPPEAPSEDLTAAPKVEYGVGMRLRYTFIPTGLIELFVERAEGGHKHPGFGLEFIRRKGDMEMALGFEYESLEGDSGFWIDKGEMIPQDGPDLLTYDGFSWFTLDFNFLWHTKLHEMVSLRYGAGLGLGIIKGKVYQQDSTCTSSDISSCQPIATAPVEENQDIPPVFPVVNIIVGAQFTPVKNIHINVEGFMHTVFYFGGSLAYMF